jgi:hypothetical protein
MALPVTYYAVFRRLDQILTSLPAKTSILLACYTKEEDALVYSATKALTYVAHVLTLADDNGRIWLLDPLGQYVTYVDDSGEDVLMEELCNADSLSDNKALREELIILNGLYPLRSAEPKMISLWVMVLRLLGLISEETASSLEAALLFVVTKLH